MKTRSHALAKSLAILLVTLLIGMLAGASITGAVVRHRLDNLRSLTDGEGFAALIIEVIEPVSEQQRATIEPLIKDVGEEIEDVVDLTRLEIYLTIEGMEETLKPHLTDEQLKRLQDRRREVRERYRRRRLPEE